MAIVKSVDLTLCHVTVDHVTACTLHLLHDMHDVLSDDYLIIYHKLTLILNFSKNNVLKVFLHF